MGNYRTSSHWTDANELRCLQILLQLKEQNYPRGMQADLCRQMALTSNLTYETTSAKVGNYKSLTGITGPSSTSSACEQMYRIFGHLTASDLNPIIEGFDDEQI